MMHSQYLRVEAIAGGAHASRRTMIRAGHTLLSPEGRSARARAMRHSWLRGLLAEHAKAQDLARKFLVTREEV